MDSHGVGHVLLPERTLPVIPMSKHNSHEIHANIEPGFMKFSSITSLVADHSKDPPIFSFLPFLPFPPFLPFFPSFLLSE